MKFIVTREQKVSNEVMISGYFKAENAREQEQLGYCIEIFNMQRKNDKHINTKGGRLEFIDIQMELVKKNLKVVSQQCQCKITMTPGKEFKGNIKELESALKE